MPSDGSPPPDSSPSHSRTPRFQFSLRWLMIVVTVVALLLGLGVFAAGQVIVGLLLAIVLRGVIPTVAIVAAVFGRGETRALAIGAVVACIPILTTEIGPLRFSALIAGTISQFVAIGICGGVAVVTCRWIERHADSDG